MKIAKNIAIAAFALLFTATVAASLWCSFTPDGKKWHKEWKEKRATAHVKEKPKTVAFLVSVSCVQV